MKIYLVWFFIFCGNLNSWSSHTSSYKNDVPEKIQRFLDTHFSNYKIDKLKYDAEDGECKVKYRNGIKVEFNHNGDWEEIESNYTPLPKSIIDMLPSPAISFIAKRFPQKPIMKIKRKSYGYKIELASSVGLKFDHQGNIIKVDS
ncbi:MAG: PepSY-like domain-containing protein [Dysgonomonas sp.]|nr:PepSY-like domain-containing protein [Dysgonomonas sp.]